MNANGVGHGNIFAYNIEKRYVYRYITKGKIHFFLLPFFHVKIQSGTAIKQTSNKI